MCLPCGGHPRAPSGQGSPCGLDGGSGGKTGRKGTVQGCWQTGCTVNQLDCPLLGETLQHRSEHAGTWSSVEPVGVQSSGAVLVLDRSVMKIHVCCRSKDKASCAQSMH